MTEVCTTPASRALIEGIPLEFHERCRLLLQALEWPGGPPPLVRQTLGVVGCAAGVGVSTLASSLAMMAASTGLGPVVLVDANFERPMVHRLFGVDQCPGLAEALSAGASVPYLRSWQVPNLAILTSGAGDASPAQVWAAPQLPEVLKTLRAEFSLVVVDLPPPDQASFVSRLAGLLDGILLVVEAERMRADAARRQKELLVRANARLLGAVLAKERQHIPTSLARLV
jgi:Mrp family chromosome partitioning ATPase